MTSAWVVRIPCRNPSWIFIDPFFSRLIGSSDASAWRARRTVFYVVVLVMAFGLDG